jgi:hypothetical protein
MTVETTEVATSGTQVCVACGNETSDRYFPNATPEHLESSPHRLPLPVALCRTCSPPPA